MSSCGLKANGPPATGNRSTNLKIFSINSKPFKKSIIHLFYYKYDFIFLCAGGEVYNDSHFCTSVQSPKRLGTAILDVGKFPVLMLKLCYSSDLLYILHKATKHFTPLFLSQFGFVSLNETVLVIVNPTVWLGEKN